MVVLILHCIQLSYLGNVVTVAPSVTIVFEHQTTLQRTLPFPWSYLPLLFICLFLPPSYFVLRPAIRS